MFSVWSDIRADSTVDHVLAKVPDNSKDALMPLCGLPISPYFSALKMKWLIDNVPAVRKAIRDQRCRFGTVDTWLVWVSLIMSELYYVLLNMYIFLDEFILQMDFYS